MYKFYAAYNSYTKMIKIGKDQTLDIMQFFFLDIVELCSFELLAQTSTSCSNQISSSKNIYLI